jgi:hypothetical protein
MKSLALTAAGVHTAETCERPAAKDRPTAINDPVKKILELFLMMHSFEPE